MSGCIEPLDWEDESGRIAFREWEKKKKRLRKYKFFRVMLLLNSILVLSTLVLNSVIDDAKLFKASIIIALMLIILWLINESSKED